MSSYHSSLLVAVQTSASNLMKIEKEKFATLLFPRAANNSLRQLEVSSFKMTGMHE